MEIIEVKSILVSMVFRQIVKCIPVYTLPVVNLGVNVKEKLILFESEKRFVAFLLFIILLANVFVGKILAVLFRSFAEFAFFLTATPILKKCNTYFTSIIPTTLTIEIL